jgi:aminopeptidase YwaD
MRKTTLCFVLATVVCVRIIAQDLPYAREVVKTLSSDEMKGRGYVENGDRKAAEFIAKEFEQCGLKKYGKTYFQTFSTPVNSFPGKMELSINGKALKPGADFLIDAGSPSINGTYETVQLSADDLLNDDAWAAKVKSSKGKLIVLSSYSKEKYNKDQLKRITDITGYLQYSKENPSKGTVIITNDKLTWSGSTDVFALPSFIIKSSSTAAPVEKITVNAENKFIKSYDTQNVVGYIEGVNKDSLLVFTAHYDHLGMMGQATMFPGANDNASGVALLLNLVKHYARNKPKYSTVFIAFAAEEIGLIGAKYFTEKPLFPLSKIKFLVNFDLAGTGDDGIQVVNGKVYQSKFDILTKLNASGNLLKQVKIRGEACNSDHCMFHMKGVRCFYIYTLGGIQAYHDIYDKAETLPFTEFEDYFKLFTRFVDQL